MGRCLGLASDCAEIDRGLRRIAIHDRLPPGIERVVLAGVRGIGLVERQRLDLEPPVPAGHIARTGGSAELVRYKVIP